MRLEFESKAVAFPQTETGESESNEASLPHDFDLLLKGGIAAAQTGDRDGARVLLIQAAELDPNSEDAWMWLASISDYPEELLAFLNHVLEINPDNDRAAEWRSATKSLLAKTFVQRAALAAKEGDVELASQCLEQALGHDDQSEHAWLLKAAITADEKIKEELLTKVLEINPDNQKAKDEIEALKTARSQALFNQAKDAAAAGERAMAVELLDEFLANSPVPVEAWILKSHLSHSLAEKIDALENALELDPENAAARSGLAFLALTFGVSSENPKPSRQDLLPATESEAAIDLKEETPESSAEINVVAENNEQVVTSESFFTDNPDFDTRENDAEAVAFAAQPTAERFDFEETPAESESEMPVESSSEDYTFDASDYENDPWKTRVGNIDSWLDEDLASGITSSEEDFTPVQTRDAEEMYDPLPEAIEANSLNTDNPATDTSEFSYLVSDERTDQFTAGDDDIDVQTLPVAAETPDDISTPEPEAADTQQITSEESDTIHCSFCTAPNEPGVTQCSACLGQFVSVEDEIEVTVPEIEDFLPELGHDVPAESRQEGNLDLQENNSSEDEGKAGATEFVDSYTELSTDFPPEVSMVGTVCPFCNTHNETQAFECGSCHAILTLSNIDSLLSNQRAKRDLVQQAVTRMEAEWNLREFDDQELTDLAVGHFNLGDSASGMKYLHEVSRLDPNNVILTGQLNAIAIRLDETRYNNEPCETVPKGKTILVVDDSPTVRKLISGKLEKSGHNVVCAVDGVEALARVAENLPDLILLDIAMPRMDGYEVCKQIRANPIAKDLPVVMISGKDGFFDKVRGRMAGCTGYVTKPFGPETLMKALETYLLPDQVEAN